MGPGPSALVCRCPEETNSLAHQAVHAHGHCIGCHLIQRSDHSSFKCQNAQEGQEGKKAHGTVYWYSQIMDQTRIQAMAICSEKAKETTQVQMAKEIKQVIQTKTPSMCWNDGISENQRIRVFTISKMVLLCFKMCQVTQHRVQQ